MTMCTSMVVQFPGWPLIIATPLPPQAESHTIATMSGIAEVARNTSMTIMSTNMAARLKGRATRHCVNAVTTSRIAAQS